MTASAGTHPSLPAVRLQIAIAVVSATLLALQVAFTRVLSVVAEFHMVFFVVSTAMLGVGLPGAVLIVKPPTERTAPRALLVAAVAIPLAVVLLLRYGRPNLHETLPLAIACLLGPFLSLGTAAAALLMLAEGPAFRRVYAADLAGGALGALGILPLMDWVPTPTLVPALAIPAAALAFHLGTKTERRIAGAISAAAVALIAWGRPLEVHVTKNYDERQIGSRRLAEKWSSTIRLTVFDRVFFMQGNNAFTWGPGSKAPPVTSTEWWIEQDGGAGTPVMRFDGDLGKLGILDYDVTSVGYQIRPAQTALIVGPGGGRDILTALRQGVAKVRAVEVNRGMVELMKGEMREYSGGIYTHPRVDVQNAEARSYIAQRDEKFDVLQISLIDSFAATAAGAHALSEGYLYTVDSVRTYIDRLAPRGILAISRWHFESMRLLGTVSAAAKAAGWEGVEDHIVSETARGVITALVSPTPFTAEERARIKVLEDLRGWEPVHPVAGSPASACVASAGRQCFFQPATDDRPFFLMYEKAFTPVFFDGTGVARTRQVALVSLVGLLLSIFLPLLRDRGRSARVVASGFYYAVIGIAFMLVEVGLTHRFIEYVGHPTTSAAVVLTGLLVGAGVGSYVLPASRSRAWLVGTSLVIAVTILIAPFIFSHTRSLGPTLRGVIAGLMSAGISFQLGAWFPGGLLRFGEERKAWFWLVNGTASVVGGITALGIALDFGFTVLFFSAAGAYGLAAILLRLGSPAGASA